MNNKFDLRLQAEIYRIIHSLLRVGILPVMLFVVTSCTRERGESVPKESPYIDSMQDKAASMVDAGDLSGGLHFFDSVIRFYKEASVADKIAYYDFCYTVYDHLGKGYRAQNYADSMLFLLEGTNNTETLKQQYAYANFNKADKLYEEGNYSKAYDYYYKAKSVAETMDDSCTLGYYDYRIGFVLHKAEKYQEAISNYKTASVLLSKCTTTIAYFYRLQETLDNIALCYQDLGQYDSALIYYNKALEEISDKRNSFPANKMGWFSIANGVIYGNMGTTYLKMGQDSTAEAYFQKSIEINSQKGYNIQDAQYTRVKLASLYLNEKRFEDFTTLVSQIDNTLKELPDKQTELRLDKLLSQYWYERDYAQSFDYLLKYRKLKDSLDNVNREARHFDIDIHVGNIEKQKEIEELEKENQLRKLYISIALLISLMSFVIVFLVVQNYRRSKRNIEDMTMLNKQMLEQKHRLEAVRSELERSDKEKDRILKAVSHDMRSPVNAALSLSDLILMDASSLAEEQVAYIELIKKSCFNALALTKDLLDAATMHSETMKMEFVDISGLLNSTVSLLKSAAGKKRQQITVIIPDGSLKIYLNKEKIQRVLNNIITNAIKFSPLNSTIEVRVETGDNDVTISVRDHGIGIPEALEDKVYDIFTEAKRFGTAGEEPAGLGLSIAKQIVEAHGGRIWFESKVNSGTTFYIYLPSQSA